MAVTWTLTRVSTNQTLSAWGLEDVRLNFENLGMDTLTFRIPVSNADSAAGWERDQAVVLLRDGVRFFAGIVENDPEANVESNAESLFVRVVGPWWYLEHIPYTQGWKVWDTAANAGAGGLVDGTKTRCVLGQADNGIRLTNGGVVSDALSKASAASTRFLTGTIDPAVSLPLDEVTDLMCAEVIRRVLRWTPDACAWFDYSTTPPTFHCRRASGLTAVDYTAGGSSPVERWTSRPRKDLQAAGVIIKYESTVTNAAGLEYYKITQESAPDGATEGDPRVLVMTIGLEGASSSAQVAQITTEQIPSDLNAVSSWWRARLPMLDGVADGDITIDVERETEHLYELISGSIPEWLDQEANAEEDTITGTVEYLKNGQKIQAYISHRMTVCDLQSGTREKFDTVMGETAPSGLAAAFYAAVGQLYYEGSVSLVYQDLPAGPFLGKRVKAPTGSYGVAQTVRLDLEAGRIEIDFGPPGHLSPTDMIEFLRANRTRTSSRSHGRRTDARATSSAPSIQTGGETPRADTVAGFSGQYTTGVTTPEIGEVIPPPTADYQTLVAVTHAEDSNVPSGSRAWRAGPPRIMVV